MILSSILSKQTNTKLANNYKAMNLLPSCFLIVANPFSRRSMMGRDGVWMWSERGRERESWEGGPAHVLRRLVLSEQNMPMNCNPINQWCKYPNQRGT